MDNFSDKASIWQGSISETLYADHTKENPIKRRRNARAKTVYKMLITYVFYILSFPCVKHNTE